MSHWKVGGDVIAYWRKGVGTTLIASNGQRYGSWLFLVIDNSSGIKGLTGIKPSVFGKLVKKTFLGMVLSLAWKPLSNTNILCCSITTNFFFQCLYFQNKIHFSCTVVVFPFFFLFCVSYYQKEKNLRDCVIYCADLRDKVHSYLKDVCGARGKTAYESFRCDKKQAEENLFSSSFIFNTSISDADLFQVSNTEDRIFDWWLLKWRELCFISRVSFSLWIGKKLAGFLVCRAVWFSSFH